MAVPVIKSAAHIPGADQMFQGPRTLAFLNSEAVSYRSREVIQVPQGSVSLWPGSFVDATGAPAATAGVIAGINCYAVNPNDGPVNVTCIVRDAEVTDAYLMYGALDPTAVNARLATLGIIVRQGVLPNTRPGGFQPDFDTSVPPQSGIAAPVMNEEGQPIQPPVEPPPETPPPTDPNAPGQLPGTQRGV